MKNTKTLVHDIPRLRRVNFERENEEKNMQPPPELPPPNMSIKSVALD